MIAIAGVLALKDLRLFLRDRAGLLLTLLLPIFLATIFAAAMGGMDGDDAGVGKVELLVEDLDGTERSRELVAALASSDGLAVGTATDVRRRVAGGKAPAALLIPSGYAADLDAGRSPSLKLFRDPGKQIEQQIVAGTLLPALLRSNDHEILRAAMRRALVVVGFPVEARPQAQLVLEQTWASLSMMAATAAYRADDGGRDDLFGPTTVSGGDLDFASSIPALLGIEVEEVAGGSDPSREAAGQSHAVSGIAVMMLLFGLAACGGSLIEEHADGTLQRLQLAPSTGSAILAGKFLYCYVIGAMQLCVLFTYGGCLFSVPVLRAPLALVVLSFAVVAAATALGMLLAVLCRSRKQLEGLSTLVILVMSALGGSWFPLIITPEWYRKLGHFTLNAWAMDGYQGIFWYGKNLGGIALEIGVLLTIAFVASALALRGWKARFGVA